MNWPEDEPRPQCPSVKRLRAFYMVDRKEEGGHGDPPLQSEVGKRCRLVDEWESIRQWPVGQRRTVCNGCARNTGAYPPSTPLYALCCRHLSLLKVKLQPGRKAYTPREMAAIAWVKSEFTRAWREKAEKDARNRES